ncbi:MAG: VWA domain-containing protein, partial [Lentisphaeria bacterium]
SDKDVAILAPTLELHGLIETKEVKESLERYAASAKDMRAANIALRVKSQSLKDNLNQAADTAVQKAVEEVMKGLRVYFMVDISGSMENAIVQAKVYIAKFLQAFPEDKLHVSVFNSNGREIKIPHRSAAGVENAFRGITASGGTDYGAGVRVLQNYKPAIDEDVLFIFVGDEGNMGINGLGAPTFTSAVRNSGLSPVAFGLVPVSSPRYARSDAVRKTATELGIPCFEMSPTTFNDVYEIPRILRNLIASTPVGVTTATRVVSTRVTLVDKILKTDLLEKPAWAA